MDNPTQIVYQDHQPVVTRRSVTLRVAKGLDEHASCRMGQHRVRVGSASDNTLILTDPRVSRYHLEFQVQDQGYLMVDLGSTNGTFYRGARVREVFLQPGAEIRLGETVLRLERGDEHSDVVKTRSDFGGLIGNSPAMQEVYGLLAAVAPSDMTVLLQGETGTGKEIVAEELHRQSPRKDHLFNVADCGSMPAQLIESELFGHERGAFTGAVSTREGIFERARGGTVFLDEIGELPLEMQTRLLRVLDRRTIKRVGGDVPRKVDVRLIAATNRDLEEEIRKKRFRQDLFYRLAGVRILLPPLRKRREDIPLLARHFLWQAGCADLDLVLTPELIQLLTSRSWPGNVRELRNVVERALVFVDGSASLGEKLEATSPPPPAPPPVSEDAPGLSEPAGEPEKWLARVFPRHYLQQPYKVVKEQVVNQLEDLYLEHLYRRHGSNISRIAGDAGIDRHLVRKLLRKHGILER